MSFSPLQIARLTPAGRGAIGTIALTGSGATSFFLRFFSAGQNQPSVADSGRSISELKQPVWGQLILPAGEEQVVVHFRSADEVEIHSHGGEQILASILNLFQAQGAKIVSWSQLYRSLLPRAVTQKAAVHLLLRDRGLIDREMESLRNRLQQGENIDAQLEDLQQRYRVGRHLITPFIVLLIGEANVGKSSLLNALCGFDRVIVDQTPGTTRDLVVVDLVIAGWLFRFIDTPGFHENPGEAELLGMKQVLASIADADLVLKLYDSTAGENFAQRLNRLIASTGLDNTMQYADSLETISNRTMTVLTKIDLLDNQNDNTAAKNRSHRISAVTGTGIESLLQAIKNRLVPEDYSFGTPIPVTEEDLLL